MVDALSRSVLEINGVRAICSLLVKYPLCVSNWSGRAIVPRDALDIKQRTNPAQCNNSDLLKRLRAVFMRQG